jgi:hypothetical protein
MTDNINVIDMQEQLARLARAGNQNLTNERSLVAATGTVPPAWLIEVLSGDNYNLYDVQQIEILTAGVNPVAISGSNCQAYNLAESFTATGSISTGTRAVMWRVGKVNVFYIQA